MVLGVPLEHEWLVTKCNLETKDSYPPPLEKGGRGGFFMPPKIPLNPPFSKGDFKSLAKISRLYTNPDY